MLECHAASIRDLRPCAKRAFTSPRMIARSLFIVASLAVLAGNMAHAIGFGRAPSTVPLGSRLDFRVAIQLAPEESLTSQCVSAEVYQGEQRLAPQAVRTALEDGASADERVLRVVSLVAIEEPLVAVNVTLGCINTVERRFTVFADPPLLTLAANPVEPPIAAPSPAPSTDTAPAAAAAAPSPIAAAPVRTDALATAAPPARASASSAAPRARPRSAAATQGGTAPVARSAAASAPISRLKLDALEPIRTSAAAASAAAAAAAASAVQEATLRVAAMAASAAIAEQAASSAHEAATAATGRMQAIEQGLEKLRADAQRDREQLVQVRAKLVEAETTSRLTPWLAGAVFALVALVLWLWLRLRRTQREQQAQWWAAANAAAQNRLSTINPPTLQPMTLPPELAPTPAVRPMAPAPGPSSAFTDSMMAEPPRDVSIEELIDLEQQADFFVVLGQDDAAIDLLMGHIRGSGGTSPLPYLKLLEIYRRLGHREAYERTRERFNHRFNAYAPDWDADLQQGRTLAEYPDVMDRLEQNWKSPLDAMAELEALMFRRAGGEVFELPAYREVLFLYSMARDLLDHQGGPASIIDVLLPLADSDFQSTTARPHLMTAESSGPLDSWRATQAPIEVQRGAVAAIPPAEAVASEFGTVDLDLTQPLPIYDDPVPRSDPKADQTSDFLDLPPPAPPKA